MADCGDGVGRTYIHTGQKVTSDSILKDLENAVQSGVGVPSSTYN